MTIRTGRQVEVAGEDGGGRMRQRRERHAARAGGRGGRYAGASRVRERFRLEFAQAFDLGHALAHRKILEVGVQHAQRAVRRGDDRVEDGARRGRRLGIGRPGQGVAAHVDDVAARERHAAEAARRPVRVVRVEGERGCGAQVAEAPRESGELVADGAAVARGQAAGHFLQQQDVDAGADRQHPFGNAVEVGAAVRRAGALFVPGDQSEHGGPFEMVRLAPHRRRRLMQLRCARRTAGIAYGLYN
ncbi:MAG: hypothetical protein ACJ8HJ_27130 [Massilia sp.]